MNGGNLTANVNKYFSFFKMRFINGLQYRVAALAGVSTQFAWGFMEITLLAAFYKADPSAFPMELSQAAAYIWLQQAFLALFMTWFLDNEIFALIMSGNIAYELARPLDLYSMWFVKNLALRASRAVLRCFPILAVSILLPEPYRFTLPAGATAFAAFLLTMLMAFLTVTAYCMIIYIISFFTISPMGVRIAAVALSEFLSGAYIPLPFLPDNIRRVIELTPFASMQNVPFRVYSGNISGAGIMPRIILQAGWLAVLVLAGKVMMNKALKKVVVQGG